VFYSLLSQLARMLGSVELSQERPEEMHLERSLSKRHRGINDDAPGYGSRLVVGNLIGYLIGFDSRFA